MLALDKKTNWLAQKMGYSDLKGLTWFTQSPLFLRSTGVSKTWGRGRVGVGVGAWTEVCLFFKECCFRVKLFFKECCFRVRVRVRVDTNPNPKTAFSKKEIDHGRALNPAFYWQPFSHRAVIALCSNPLVQQTFVEQVWNATLLVTACLAVKYNRHQKYGCQTAK